MRSNTAVAGSGVPARIRGHSDLEPTAEQRMLSAHADRYRGLRYLRPSLAAEMPLDELPAAHAVAGWG